MIFIPLSRPTRFGTGVLLADQACPMSMPSHRNPVLMLCLEPACEDQVTSSDYGACNIETTVRYKGL